MSAGGEPSHPAWHLLIVRARDLDRFVGIPYCLRSMDCADLVLKVQAELFGRQVMLPGARPRPLRAEAQWDALRSHVDMLACRVDDPADGALVLMTNAGETHAGHAGTFFWLDHQGWVLHTSHTLGASVLHRAASLPSMGLHVEGWYRWGAAARE
jgi:hypothetical protein